MVWVVTFYLWVQFFHFFFLSRISPRCVVCAVFRGLKAFTSAMRDPYHLTVRSLLGCSKRVLEKYPTPPALLDDVDHHTISRKLQKNGAIWCKMIKVLYYSCARTPLLSLSLSLWMLVSPLDVRPTSLTSPNHLDVVRHLPRPSVC